MDKWKWTGRGAIYNIIKSERTQYIFQIANFSENLKIFQKKNHSHPKAPAKKKFDEKVKQFVFLVLLSNLMKFLSRLYANEMWLR
jgi:hypothetical protein